MLLRLVCAISAFLFFLHCGSHLNIRVVTEEPSYFDRISPSIRTVAIVAVQNDYDNKTGHNRWIIHLTKALHETLTRYGYFRMVAPQTATPDGVIHIELNAPIENSCAKTTHMRLKEVCHRQGNSRQCTSYAQPETTSHQLMKMSVRVRFVDPRVGTLVEHDELVQLFDSKCVVFEDALRSASELAANKIARAISARTEDFRVPLLSNEPETMGVKSAEIRQRLEVGILSAEKQDHESAGRQWLDALKLSDNKSPAAHWNLAAYFWSKGDFVSARAHFDSALANDTQARFSKAAFARSLTIFKREEGRYRTR